MLGKNRTNPAKLPFAFGRFCCIIDVATNRKEVEEMQYRRQYREIDLNALAHNVRQLRQTTRESVRLMAVVKADAYGHGLLPVARTALSAGADALAVALVEEGETLRSAGIKAPVLVLGATSPEAALGGVAQGLTLTICDGRMVHLVEEACSRLGRSAEVHLKLDTGMGRIGARNAQEVREVLAALQDCPHVQLTGAFTHFADADGPEASFTLKQLEQFQSLASLLPPGLLLHAANSAAIHRFPESLLNMARMGISMYGYPPVPTEVPLLPCMRWVTEVVYVKEIAPGDAVSYGCTFRAAHPMQVATVAVGYGDGYHRALSGRGQVLIGGRHVPILGRVCMDQMMVDVTGLPPVHPGDEVVLLGRQGDAQITAEDLARWAGTISYEILLAPTARVPRVYVGDEHGAL